MSKTNKKLIDSLARVIAVEDPKFDMPLDDLPYHRQLSCRVMAGYIINILTKLEGGEK